MFEVEINGLIINIYEVEAHVIEQKADKTFVSGCFEPRQAEIYVDKSLEINVYKRTLLHELTHAVLEANGFSPGRRFNEEELCDFVAAHSEQIVNIANKYMYDVKFVDVK